MAAAGIVGADGGMGQQKRGEERAEKRGGGGVLLTANGQNVPAFRVHFAYRGERPWL